jgi:RNA polymerase sigma-70 factor (ECF subfamily)
VATRLSIDVLRSARVRREQYVGEWLPEPLVSDPAEDPARQAEIADSLSLAFLVLLESLSPEQRAAFLLHDVFDYGYGEVAEIVGKTEANARQLATRARRHVEEQRPRFEASREERVELARRFFAAAQEGDVASLEALLADDVVLHGDGGGKVPALARAVFGRSRVARTLGAWFRQGAKVPEPEVREVEVNGQPGALLMTAGRVGSVMALEIADGRVQGIRSIVNPDKLGHVGEVADWDLLLKGRLS